MRTLRDIFAETNEAEVVSLVTRLYDCKKEWLPAAIANTLAELRRLTPDANGISYELHIDLAEPLFPEDAPGWEVWMRKADEPAERYSFSLSPGQEWLAVEVPGSLRARMAVAEIVAHCIWDMTFHGWTQGEIAGQRAELDRRVREIDEGKAELIPWEEVKARLDATPEKGRANRARE